MPLSQQTPRPRRITARCARRRNPWLVALLVVSACAGSPTGEESRVAKTTSGLRSASLDNADKGLAVGELDGCGGNLLDTEIPDPDKPGSFCRLVVSSA